MGFQYIKYLQLKCHIPQLIMTIFPGTRFPAYPFSFPFQNDSCSISTKNHINNPNRINLPSPRPQWSLFSLSLIHIFATGSAAWTDLFYWDGLNHPFKISRRHSRHETCFSLEGYKYNIIAIAISYQIAIL